MLAVQDVPRDKTGSYGIVATEDFAGRQGRISAIVEKPEPEDAPSTLAVVGRYVLDARIFELLEQTQPGAGGEIQLTDAIAQLLKEQDGPRVSLPGHALRLRHAHRPDRSDDPLRARPRDNSAKPRRARCRRRSTSWAWSNSSSARAVGACRAQP